MPRHRVGVKPLFAAFCLLLAGCAPGWKCVNRTIPVGTWLVECRYINADRSCSGAPSGGDYALVMVNHEQLHAREYALFVTDRRARPDSGGNALFQVLPKSPNPAQPALPISSDEVVGGASKAGVLTVALHQTDVESLAGADGFHLEYTPSNASSPSLVLTTSKLGDVSGAVIETMNSCLDEP